MSDKDVHEDGMKRVPYDHLKKACRSIFIEAGISEGGSETIADCLVQTSARGVHTHGVMRMGMYTKSLRTDDIDPAASPEVVKESAGTALIDMNNGMGHIGGAMAMEMATDKAKKCGVGCVGVAHSTHFGAAGYYALKAVEGDCVGIALTNAPAVMAPWGGVERLVGNNPFAIGFPPGDRVEFPIVLDMAISKVSNTRVRQAARSAKAGEGEVPPGWAIDEKGEVTQDEEKILEGKASVLPIGEHKGYGLAVMVDLLTGVLMESSFDGRVGHRHTPENEDVAYNMIAIDPEKFTTLGTLRDNIDQLSEDLKGSQLAEGVEKIYLPGEPEYEKELVSKEQGVPVEEEVVEKINELLEEYELQDLKLSSL